MPFAIVAVNFDAYRNLPTAQHRWLLTCLARYADRAGKCWPSMRQLATDSRMSLATVCRYLKSMAALGVFQRHRKPGGRFQYLINEALRPRWQGRVPLVKHPVPRDGTQKAFLNKHKDSPSNSIAAEPPLTPAERAERVRRLDAVIAGLIMPPTEMRGARWKRSSPIQPCCAP